LLELSLYLMLFHCATLAGKVRARGADRWSAVLLTCGEVTTDLVSTDAATFVGRPGGSALNTAVAAARLGGRVGILARISTDRLGRRLRDHLAAEGVDLSRVVDTPDPNVIAVAVPGDDGSAEYRFALDGAADWHWTRAELATPGPPVQAVLFGSMALAMPPGGRAILAMAEDLRRTGTATVVFDPNMRAATPTPPEVLRRAVRAAHLVKASDADLAALAPGDTPERVVAAWLDAGPRLVAVTRGAAGVTLHRAGRATLAVPATPVRVVDTIGAGDTFTAGLLTFLAEAGALGDDPAGRLDALSDEALQAAARFAADAAARCCERAGADPPTRAELTDSPLRRWG
jgi:fructokinase